MCNRVYDFYSGTTKLECGYVTNCSNEYVCGTEYEWQRVCVTRPVYIYHTIYAYISRTNWAIYRGVATVNSGSIAFSWLLHESGFYDTVLNLGSSISSNVAWGVLPPGYIPPPTYLPHIVQVQGVLNSTNQYPYTDNRANQQPLLCLTAVGNEYV